MGVEIAFYRDRAGAFEGGHHDLVEGHAFILRSGAVNLTQAFDIFGVHIELLCGGGDEHALQVIGCLNRCIADHVGHPRRIGAIVLRCHPAVGGDDFHPGRIDTQHLGDALDENGRRALTDFGCAGQNDDGAVEIELQVDGRMRLAGPVHRFGGTRHIMRTRHAEPLARCQLALAGFPARGFLDDIEAFGQTVGINPQIVGDMAHLGDQVRAPHRERIEAKLDRHFIHHVLERVAHIDGAVTAERAAGRCVGQHPLAVIPHVLQIVDCEQHRA